MRISILKIALGLHLVFLYPSLSGQNTFPDQVEKAYGLDKDLVNGVQYSNRYTKSLGHPYFLEDKFENGSVTINGRIYKNVHLKYDLFAQQIEIEYLGFSGEYNRLITVSEHMDAFSFGRYDFRKEKILEESAKFYQVIPTEHFTFFLYWGKNRIPIQNNPDDAYRFTNYQLSYWIEVENEIKTFNNRKTFVKLFPIERQDEIIKLLRKNNFSFRNPTPNMVFKTMRAIGYLFDMEVTP